MKPAHRLGLRGVVVLPAVNDVLRITYCGEILDQQVCNVMYYAVGVWTGNIDLTDALEFVADSWFATLIELQSDQFQWVSAVLDNVTDPVEFANYAPIAPVQGLRLGDALPPYNAISIRQNRTSNLTRNGYKRIGGLAESSQSNGVLDTTSPSPAVWLAAKDLMINAVGNADFQFFPAIVGRNALGQPDLTRVNFPASTDIQLNVTTQNTRKIGRGS